MNLKQDRRKPEYGFFGRHYMEGDDSKDGYLIGEKQTLDERTKKEVEGIINLLDPKEGAKFLDLPTGYGRHAIELAKEGYNVTGMDINPEHLKVAKTKGALIDNLIFLEQNMGELNRSEEFDFLINMFYSFGFFDTDDQNLDVLKRFYDSLKPGGKFLMHTDVNIPRIIDGSYKTHEFRELASGNKLEIIDNYNSQSKKIEGAWIIHQPNGSIERKDYFVRVYTKDEFEQMCKDVGFSNVITYSDRYKSDYSVSSEDMMVVATK